MPKKANSLTIIAVILAVLYGLIAWVDLQHIRVPELRGVAAIEAVLYFVLVISSLALLRYQEWARRLLVIVSAMLLVLGIGVYFAHSALVHLSYLLLAVIVIGYFSQPHVRILFKKDLKFERKSVLVVDDDEGLVKTVQRILLSNGYSVLAATSGERGIQVARVQKPDLIILDVILPGIKGREVCATLKEDPQTREIPVVFLTAKDSPDDINAELAAGAVSHLTKPVDAKMLVAQVKEILGG